MPKECDAAGRVPPSYEKPGMEGARKLSLYDQAWIVQGALGLLLIHSTKVKQGHIVVDLLAGECRVNPLDLTTADRADAIAV